MNSVVRDDYYDSDNPDIAARICIFVCLLREPFWDEFKGKPVGNQPFLGAPILRHTRMEGCAASGR